MHATMPEPFQNALTQAEEARIIVAALRDPAAFAPLYQQHSPDIYRFCYTRLGDREAANDLTARIFVRAIERLGQYTPRPGATFRSWLFTIARNMLADDWRRRREIRPLDDVIEYTRDDDAGPEHLAVHRSEMERLRLMLAQLPERQREIVELRLLDFTTSEIAAALGLTIAAVKSAQTRAYANLRTRLADPKGAPQ